MKLASTGYLQAHIYTSNAQLPLSNVAVVVTSPDGTAIAMRITDRSGLIDPIEIPVPPLEESQEPGSGERPYTQVNLIAELPGYERIEAENLQIFAGTTTYQNLEMIPLSSEPFGQNRTIRYITPPQNL